MQHKPAIPTLILCFFYCIVGAQSVTYSSIVSNDINTRFEVIGKAGNFYWLYKTKPYNSYKNGVTFWPRDDRSFAVYDGRLNFVKEISSSLSDSVVKEYLIPQAACFDQLLFKKLLNKTSVVVNRFAPNGAGAVKNAQLFDFPAQIALEDILVTRSPDRTKILVLGFVPGTNVTPDLYARVYTADWSLLNETIYKEGNLVQPFLQYDRTEYVRETCDASPIKILNSGDWLMVAPARLKNSYILCHFRREDSSLVQVDLQQPKNAGIEYFNLSVEEDRDAYVGILENISPGDKRLRMVQYSLEEKHMGYDTAYSFHLPNTFKNVEYEFEEEFIQIPGKGFMYLKEYGRQYFFDYYGDQIILDNEQQYAAYANHASKLKFNEDEYTRNSSLSDTKKRFERGDLSVRYFPFHPGDSCWGGLIHVEQGTELRYADLSYACVPARDKIVFLYNSLAKNLYKVSSTIMLDHKGQPVDDGVIFWRSDKVLNFQKARLIQRDELFVPFDRNSLQGFAIIHF